MTRRSAGGGTIANTPSLQGIIEWKPVGDALGFDTEGPRRDQGHFAVAESASSAAVIDDGCTRAVRCNSPAARLISMFELRELKQVGKALADGRFGPGHSIDLP